MDPSDGLQTPRDLRGPAGPTLRLPLAQRLIRWRELVARTPRTGLIAPCTVRFRLSEG